jgi:lipopolysaccharide cholinephosphotransferase
VNDKKVRVRTKKELAIRKKEFLKICKILDSLNINYFLQTGILLGAIRDKDLIKWDWDIEISVFANQFLKKIDLVAKALKKNKFTIININNKKQDSKIDFKGKLEESVTGYTIFSWNYSKLRKVYWRREYSVPEHFLKNLSKIKFFNRYFKCPSYPKEYLSFAYGDWKTPIRTSVKHVYNTSTFKNKNIYILLNFMRLVKRQCLRIIN